MLSLTNMPLRLISPGVFELGKIRLDKARREVSFPAVLNLNHGPMEYLLVTSYGKTHESVFRTDVRPFYIHIAMLLLGANASNTATNSGQLPQNGPGILANPSTIDLPGDRISIEVSWLVLGKPTRRPAETLLYNQETGAGIEKANWVYNGSRIVQGYFLAHMGGSIVSLVTDADALANNEGRGHNNDKIWFANTNSLPPANQPLEVTFRLEEEKNKPLSAGQVRESQ